MKPPEALRRKAGRDVHYSLHSDRPSPRSPLMRCVSGPSRKATPSLICLMEASQLDLASPAYSRPSCVPLRSPFTISSQNAFYYLMTRPGITASPLRPASSCVLLRSPAFPCILLRSPAFPCVLLCYLASASCVLCGLVVSRTFRRFLGPERVYSPPCVYLPSCSNHPLPVL